MQSFWPAAECPAPCSLRLSSIETLAPGAPLPLCFHHAPTLSSGPSRVDQAILGRRICAGVLTPLGTEGPTRRRRSAPPNHLPRSRRLSRADRRRGGRGWLWRLEHRRRSASGALPLGRLDANRPFDVAEWRADALGRTHARVGGGGGGGWRGSTAVVRLPHREASAGHRGRILALWDAARRGRREGGEPGRPGRSG